MYSDFLMVSHTLDKASAINLLGCACQTHPVQRINKTIRHIQVHSLTGIQLIIKIGWMKVCLLLLASVLPLCPKLFIGKVTSIVVRLLKKGDCILLEFISKTQLVICRPLSYGHVFTVESLDAVIEIIQLENQINGWNQMKDEPVEPYNYSLWRMEYMRTVTGTKAKLIESKKRLFENFMYHPFWYECLIILFSFTYVYIYMNPVSPEALEEMVIIMVVADLTIRTGRFLLRFIRIHLALLHISTWLKPLIAAQKLLHLRKCFSGRKVISKGTTKSKSEYDQYEMQWEKLRRIQSKWLKYLSWSIEGLTEPTPHYCVLRLYALIAGVYGLIKLAEVGT